MIALLLAAALSLGPAELGRPLEVVSATTADRYRRVAEGWREEALSERELRRQCHEDRADDRRVVEAWRDAARAKSAPRTPEWLWPTVSGAAVIAFGAGFLLGHRDRRE